MAMENIENVAGTTTEGSVSSGTASDAMIKAAMASEASDAGSAGTETVVPATAPTGAESVVKPAGDGTPAPTEGAKGPQVPTGAVPPAKPGDAPENRIVAAVANARKETRAEVEKEFAWAKGIDPNSVRTAFDITGDLLKDPKGFAIRLAGEVGLQLAQPGVTPPAGPKTEEIDLTPRLRSEDGEEVYTVKQARALVDKALAEVRGEIKPLLDARKTQEQQDNENRLREKSKQDIANTLTHARTWKHFQMAGADGKMVDNPAIFTKLLDIPEKERRELGPVASLYKAYNLFLEESIFPTLSQQTEAQVRTDNARKAAASLSARPGSSSGDGTPVKLRDGDIDGLAAHLERLSGAAAV